MNLLERQSSNTSVSFVEKLNALRKAAKVQDSELQLVDPTLTA